MQNPLLPWLAALKTGILLSLSWPTFGFTPLIFVAWIPLIWAFAAGNLGPKPGRRIFLLALISMLVWNGLTTWWVGLASGVGAGLAIGLNSFFMALLWRLAYGVKRQLGLRMGLFSLLFIWMSYEFIHYRWELIWPWLNLGNAFSENVDWVQWYSYTGVLGGSLWIWIFNLMGYQVYQSKHKIDRMKFGGILILVAILPPLISMGVKKGIDPQEGEAVEVVVVQPNIDAYTEKYEIPVAQQLNKLIRLAKSQDLSSTDWVIYPETAIPNGIWHAELDENWALDGLKSLRKDNPKLNIITGASTFQRFKEDGLNPPTGSARYHKSGRFWYDAYNSALFLHPSGETHMYQKSKLVPGVEQMPYDEILKPLKSLAFDLGGTTGTLGKQDSASTFVSDMGSVAPIICYESVCGDYVGDFIEAGAGFLAIITNDDWWGDTPGYKQHFSYAKLRAVEGRRWIARAANTGISGFINPLGEVVVKTEFKEDASLKETLYLRNDLSFYVRYGDYLGRISMFFAGLLILYGFVKSRLPEYAK